MNFQYENFQKYFLIYISICFGFPFIAFLILIQKEENYFDMLNGKLINNFI
jgi:hypothetical protein